MKIQDAKKAYAAQMDTLWTRKRDLSQALKNCQQGGAPNVDRVEISRELSAVDAQYNEAQGVMESIIERETAIHNAEVAKQQGNALSKAAEEMGKMLEIYPRIASGGQVPPEDEQRLMEYNHKLYMAAKTAAMLQEGDGEKYDSLFEDEEEKNGEETIYHVEFAVKNKESEAGTLNPNVLSIYTKRTMTVTYNEQEKRIKRIDIMRTGVKNSAEYVPVSDQDILTFK